MCNIILRNANKVYGSNRAAALQDFDLIVSSGEFVSIVGSNGSGKSTLLKVISGAASLTSGRLWLDSKNVTDTPQFLRNRQIAAVPQHADQGTAMGMTVEENLTLAILKNSYAGLPFSPNRRTRAAIMRHLSKLGIPLTGKLTSRASELSGGERQFLVLAMAFLQNSRLLLLDEHTAALDPQNREAVNQVTATIAAELNATVLMVSHSIEDALRMGTRLLVLRAGRLARDFRERMLRNTTLDEIKREYDE